MAAGEKKKLIADFFEVSIGGNKGGLEAALWHIDSLEGKARNSSFGRNPIRLQSLKEHGRQFLAGVMSRVGVFDGGMRGDLDGVLKEEEYKQDEGPARTSTFLYHLDSGVLIMERGRLVASQRSMERYIKNIGDVEGDVELIPYFHPDFWKHMATLKRHTRVRLKAAAPQAPELLKDDKFSETYFSDLLTALGANAFQLEFSVGTDWRAGALDRPAVNRLLNKVVEHQAEGADINMHIVGRDEDDDLDEIDLLKDRITFSDKVTMGHGRLVPNEVKFSFLQNAWTQKKGLIVRS